MDRRRVLAAAGVAVAGCLESPFDDGRGPGDAGAVLAYDTENELHRIDADFEQRDVGHFYLAVLSSDDHATAIADRVRSDDARSFLEATDFGRSVVVVLQDRGGQSSPDLAVRSAERAADHVELAVEYPGGGGTTDVSQDMLFVRVPVPDGSDVPSHATVSVARGGGERSTTLSTVGRYGRERLREARDVVVRNRDCATHFVSMSGTIDGELVYDPVETVRYEPGSIVRFRDVLAEAGSYRFEVAHRSERDGPRGSNVGHARAAIGEEDEPAGLFVDVGGPDDMSLTFRPEADLPDAGETDCLASDLPYESDDPGENLSRPAHVVWENQSDEDRSVRVVVADLDRTLFDQRLELPTGESGRTVGLIARAGEYSVDVEPRQGDSRTVRWRVVESEPDLLVGVDPAGELVIRTTNAS